MSERFVLRDKSCPYCKEEFDHGFDCEYTHEGLTLVVEVCGHASRPFQIADDIIVDFYGELFCSREHDSDFENAKARDTPGPSGYKYYWQHLVDEIDRCGLCGEECTRRIGRYELERFRVSAEAAASVGRRFCFGCKLVAIGLMKDFDRREIELWVRQQQEQREELQKLRKVRALFAQSKKALRENKDQSALQSLKEEFAQVANLPR